MAASDSSDKGSTVDRIVSRLDKKSLQRRAMPGGGEVYSGELATRALQTLGARAMTLDRSIIVAEDFNPAKPEDQALFAHEQYHVQHSGGVGTHDARDGEEVEARAVERMVLNRAVAGGVESFEGPGRPQSGTSQTGSATNHSSRSNAEAAVSAARAYQNLMQQGHSHTDIVHKLADIVMQQMDSSRDHRMERGGKR